RQLLRDVDLLAAAVVTAPRVTLRVLVGEHGARGVKHRLGYEVLGRNHLQRALLAVQLAPEDLGNRRVDLGQRGRLEVGWKVVHWHRFRVTEVMPWRRRRIAGLDIY